MVHRFTCPEGAESPLRGWRMRTSSASCCAGMRACSFVTKAELAKLGLGHLLGTPLLRAYMHGYFVHNRLHSKARALAQPFAYEAYRQQRVSAKLDAERKSRIGLVRKLPKVCACAPACLVAPGQGVDAPYLIPSLGCCHFELSRITGLDFRPTLPTPPPIANQATVAGAVL